MTSTLQIRVWVKISELRDGKQRGRSASFQCKVLDNQRGRKGEASEPHDDMCRPNYTTEHRNLLSRLSSWFGITGTVLDWFQSYL